MLQALETVTHTTVPDIAPDPDTNATKQSRIHDKICRQTRAVLVLQTGHDFTAGFGVELGRGFDGRLSLPKFEPQEPQIIFEKVDIISRPLRNDGLNNDVSVTFSAVPEPGSGSLLMVGATGLLRRRRAARRI